MYPMTDSRHENLFCSLYNCQLSVDGASYPLFLRNFYISSKYLEFCHQLDCGYLDPCIPSLVSMLFSTCAFTDYFSNFKYQSKVNDIMVVMYPQAEVLFEIKKRLLVRNVRYF